MNILQRDAGASISFLLLTYQEGRNEAA